jgi:hypothetical protein
VDRSRQRRARGRLGAADRRSLGLVADDKRGWQLANGLQITCIGTQWAGGIEEISGVGGTQAGGSPWNSPVGAVIVAIQDGQSYFVVTPVEALLVSVYVDATGKKRLKAGFDENDARLLHLARCV